MLKTASAAAIIRAIIILSAQTDTADSIIDTPKSDILRANEVTKLLLQK